MHELHLFLTHGSRNWTQTSSLQQFTAALFPDFRCVCVFYFLQEWAEELFNLASNLLVQNMSREACLEKAYVTGCMHTRTRKQSRTKCKSTVPKIDMKIRSASTRNVTHSRSHIRDLMYFTWTKMVKCYVKILRNHHVAFTPSPKHICAYIVHTLQSTTQPEPHFSHINGGSKNRRKQDYQNSWKYVYTSL